MKPESTPAPPDRRALAKIAKIAISVCLVVMAAGAIIVAVGGHQSPPARLAVTAGIGCLAGAFVVLFQGMQKLALDPKYQLSGKGVALLLALGAATIVLIFWSIFL
jgi:hypothetical protein